jgi:hypothetical protein
MLTRRPLKPNGLGWLPLLAQMRSADRFRECLLFGVDRKSSAHPQNDAIDPKRTYNGDAKHRDGRATRSPARNAQNRESALRPLQVESCQELIRDRSPPIWIKQQQMAVAWNSVE